MASLKQILCSVLLYGELLVSENIFL